MIPTLEEILESILTGRQESTIINPINDGSIIFGFWNKLDELQGRWIQYGERREFERDRRNITARCARCAKRFAENNLYVQDGIKISERELCGIDNQISAAKSLMGITDTCKIPFVISCDEFNIAAYNPRTDVIFIDPRFGKVLLSRELQEGFACPGHELSTLVHELFHWQDAYEYRKNGGVIKDAETLKKYTVEQREICREKLLAFGVDLDDSWSITRDISPYAGKKHLENELEEVLAEYRAKKLLERGDLK